MQAEAFISGASSSDSSSDSSFSRPSARRDKLSACRESFLGRLVSARYVILAKSPMAATAVSERWKLQCDHLFVEHKTFRNANLYLMKIPRMHRFMVSLLTVDEKRRFEVRLSYCTIIDKNRSSLMRHSGAAGGREIPRMYVCR